MNYIAAGLAATDTAYQLYKKYGPGVKSLFKGRGARPWRGSFKYSKKAYRYMKRRTCAPEIHYVDTAGALAVIPAGSAIIRCAEVAQGDDFNNRTGRIIVGKYLQLNIQLAPPTGAGNMDYVQIVVVVDKQPDAAGPIYNDIFDTLVAPVGQCFRNLKTNSSRFKILTSFHVAMANGAGGVPVVLQKMVKIPLALSRQVYSSTAATYPETNAYYIVVASFVNSGAAATAASYSYAARFAFHEC